MSDKNTVAVPSSELREAFKQMEFDWKYLKPKWDEYLQSLEEKPFVKTSWWGLKTKTMSVADLYREQAENSFWNSFTDIARHESNFSGRDYILLCNKLIPSRNRTLEDVEYLAISSKSGVVTLTPDVVGWIIDWMPNKEYVERG